MSSLHTLQQLVLLPGHMQSVPQFLLSQSQAGQQGKSNERGIAIRRSLRRKSRLFSLLSLLTFVAGFPQPGAVSPDGFPRPPGVPSRGRCSEGSGAETLRCALLECHLGAAPNPAPSVGPGRLRGERGLRA